jgi:glycosyltransferase involved in cell wall biosynthesis
MRIAHVLRRLSFDDWGGTEQVVWNLAKAQRAAGHEVRLFATTALCGKERETVDGLDILRFKPIYPWWPMPKSLVAELDRKGGNPFVPGLANAIREWLPDILHCHAMGRIAELCIRLAGELKRHCFISLHGGAANVPAEEARSLKAPTRGRLPWGKLVERLLGWTRRVPEDADGIVCVGADECEHYQAVHPHVMYLPNGVDVERYEPCRLHERRSLLEECRVLCVARIDRQKNQRLLVEALANHPQMELRLVGPVTQPDYAEELKRLAAERGCECRLTMTGALPHDSNELLSEYSFADVFALPSRHEPFGIAVLEAWAAGLPVIASDVGGLGRLCAAHPGAALTFEPGKLNAFEEALERLVKDDALANQMRAAGLAAARNYDWRLLASRLVEFYRLAE